MDKRIILSATSLLILLPGCVSPLPDKDISFPSSTDLQNLALKESRLAVHPGIPGKTPFWNAHAERFIYAPAFDFPETESADNYRFSIFQEGCTDTLTFIAEKPWAPLTPVWDKVKTGSVKLLVEALNNGHVIGRSGERVFYRASPYRGPYHTKDQDYSESAGKLFRYLYRASYIQYWEEHGKPDPNYGLYGYPAKMFSAVVSGMLIFSELTDDQYEKETAIRIAISAADYLIRISEPGGKPLEYFPPTYTGPIYADMENEYRGESLADRMMLIYPAAAGQVYLDLYNTTGDRKYFDAALRIAESYRKIQLENGTWHLMVYLENGAPVTFNYVVPTGVVGFLDRISEEYGQSGFSECAGRALDWLGENLVRDFNWEGQFEDQKPADRYKNLSKGQAYDKTGKILYLAKALDLANTLLHVQDPGSGHYPTYLVTNLLDQEGWINCMVYTARTIIELDKYLNEISPAKEITLPD